MVFGETGPTGYFFSNFLRSIVLYSFEREPSMLFFLFCWTIYIEELLFPWRSGRPGNIEQWLQTCLTREKAFLSQVLELVGITNGNSRDTWINCFRIYINIYVCIKYS